MDYYLVQQYGTCVLFPKAWVVWAAGSGSVASYFVPLIWIILFVLSIICRVLF